MYSFNQSVPRRRWIVVILLAAGLVLSACKTGGAKRDGEEIDEQPPIRAKDKNAQERFDRAMVLLEEGEYQKAREAFRLIQAEFGGDPIAHLAELYVARAAMGDVSIGTSFGDEASYKGSKEAARILVALAETEEVDQRIRYGAQVYHALELALRGSTGEAMEAVADYPSASLSDVVLERDRAPVWVLLTEGLYRAGRYPDAFESAAGLYGAVQARIDEATGADAADDTIAATGPAQTRTTPQTPELRQLRSWQALARERAFDIADEHLDDVALQEYSTADAALLRAAAGWGLLGGQLEGGVAEEQRAALEDLFNRISPDMITVGAGQRAAELSMRLAAVGGPKRIAFGVLLPLSGPVKAIGQRAMAGALTATRAYHDLGHPEVTLVFQDSQGEPSEVFAALQKQDVLAVVGPLDSRRAAKFAPLARQAQIPLIALTTAWKSEASDEAGDEAEQGEDGEEAKARLRMVFRNFIDARAEARAAARIAFEEIGDRRAAVVYPDVGYGRITSKAFADEFRALGGQVVAELRYDRSKSDFARVASKLAAARAQAVFVPDSAQKVAELSAFFANENIWGLAPDAKPPKRSNRQHVHYLGTSLWEDPILVRQAASYVQGATIPAWFSPQLPAADVQNFARRFEAIYRRKPENFEAFSYDTVQWLRSLALERGMRRPEAIRDALLAGDRHDGVTGTVYMSADGEAVRTLRFVTPTSDGFESLPFTAQTHRVRAQAGDGEAGAAAADASSADGSPEQASE